MELRNRKWDQGLISPGLERYLPRSKATTALMVEPEGHKSYIGCKMEEIRRIKERAQMKMNRYLVDRPNEERQRPPMGRNEGGDHKPTMGVEATSRQGISVAHPAALPDINQARATGGGQPVGCNRPMAEPGEKEKVCRREEPDQGRPEAGRGKSTTFSSTGEEKLPRLADNDPPRQGRRPISKRSPSPSHHHPTGNVEKPEGWPDGGPEGWPEGVPAEVASPPPRPAFVRAGVEQHLNQHARPCFELEPYQGKIHAVNGIELAAVGKIRGGIYLRLEGAKSSLQGTLADNTIKYHPVDEVRPGVGVIFTRRARVQEK